MTLDSLNAKGSYFKITGQLIRLKELEINEAQYQGSFKNPVAGEPGQSPLETDIQMAYIHLHSHGVSLLLRLEFWERELDCPECPVGRGRVQGPVTDTAKGIDRFCKEKPEHCQLKHIGSILGRQNLTTSHIALAGNDFSWSKAFPENQLLMMSEV